MKVEAFAVLGMAMAFALWAEMWLVAGDIHEAFPSFFPANV